MVEIATALPKYPTCLSQRTISDYIVSSLAYVQSVLLIGKKVNEVPTTIRTAKISVYVKRYEKCVDRKFKIYNTH